MAYAPRPDRVEFSAALAQAWIALAATPARERRIGIVLANYPNRDGRLGNGVGLDTPAGTLELLRAMAAAGYAVDGIPADGNSLIAALAAGPTNAETAGREIRERFRSTTISASSPASPRSCATRWTRAGERRNGTRSSWKARTVCPASRCPPCDWAT